MAIVKDDIVRDFYNNLKNKKQNNNIITEKKAIVLDSDKNNGWIYRYFMKQNNNIYSAIIEIDLEQWKKYNNNPFYNTIKIKWKITGDYNYIKETNFNIINDAEYSMKGIKNKLQKNLLEYCIN